MTIRARSRKEELAQLRDRIRAEGWTYDRIAAHIRDEHGVNIRVAYRLARGLTQQQVADLWNVRWPREDGLKTGKHISYWEAWPAPSGRTPSLDTIGRLAVLYECRPGDLLDQTDYPHEYSGAIQPYAPQGGTAEIDVRTPAAPASRALRPLADDYLAQTPAPQSDPLIGEFSERLAALANAADNGLVSSARQRDAAFKQLMDFFVSWAQTMNRRVLLHHISWAAATAAAAPVFQHLDPDQQEHLAAAIQQPGRIDATVVEHVEQVLWRCIRQDDALGPQAALDTVLAQRNLAYAMLAECPTGLRPRLLSVFANLSRYAGWLAFDLQDYDSATYYYEQARTAAHDAENTALGALVLCNLSHLATWQHRPRIGIDHAVAAQAWAAQTDDMPLRAYAADVAARAYAMDRQTAPCLRELDNARHHIAAVNDEPTLVHFYNPELLDSIHGLCLLGLGQPAAAVEHTRRSVAALDPAYVRNAAFNTVYLGMAHLANHDIDAAASSLADAAALTVHNRSARLVQQIHDVRRDLTPWAGTRIVHDLDERLRTYGLV